MPKTTKRQRRVVIAKAASAIIAPTADETASYGSPSYNVNDDTGAVFYHADRVSDRAEYIAATVAPGEYNRTMRAIAVSGLDTSRDTETLYDAADDINAMLDFDNADPDPDPLHRALHDLGESDDPGSPSVPNVEPPAVTNDTVAASTSSLNDRALARAAAARAVAAFYAGASLPFKAAADLKRKAPINFALHRAGSARSAALLATILTYCDVQPGSLQFVRGSGRVPRRLINPDAPTNDTLSAGPESGGLSNLMPDRVDYVSGALAGPGCENAIFRICYAGARANLLAFNDKQADGEHVFSAALGLLDLLHDTPTEPTPTE